MKSIITYRQTLGLTALEAEVYEMLLLVGSLPADQIAIGLDCSRHAVYRIVNDLVKHRFAVIRKGWPRIYEAVPLSVALYQVEQTNRAEQATLQATMLGAALQSSSTPEIGLLSGRQALYDRYVVEAQKAETEILVFAIGIAYSAILQDVQEEVCRKGVEVRHIVQRYTRENYHIIKKWQRLGVKMRHHPAPLGFHLMVFDGQTVILSLSNPQDTEQRTSMVLHNPVAAVAMRDYFFSVWATSGVIRPTDI